jgi:hypothetical protein
MRSLEDMHIGQRVMLTVAIVVIVILILACIGYLSGRWEAEAQTIAPSKFDKRIVELDREAIDEAYREKIQALFNTWLSDPSDQPTRALKGAQNARRAYIGAMQAIERKEAEMAKP